MLPAEELVQRLKDRLAYDPKLADYHDSLMRRLSDRYVELAETTPYGFFQRKQNLQLRAAVTGSSGTREFTASLANFRRLTANTATWLESDWAGNGIFVSAAGEEVQIGYVDTTGGYVYLADPVDTISGTEVYNWSIRFDSYLMPADTVQVLGYTDRATDGVGRLGSMSRRAEEMVNLDATESGQPTVTVEDDSYLQRAPYHPPTVLADAVSGTLPVRTWDYRYTRLYAGVESAPSPSARIKMTAGQKRVGISDLEDVRWDPGTGLLATGIRRRVYRRDVTREGPWLLVAELADSVVTTYYDSAELPVTAQGWDTVEHDAPSGARQSNRFWLTASEDRIIQLRIWFRPPPLQGKTDTVFGPQAMCNYLVESVAADLLSGRESDISRTRAAQSLASMSNQISKRDERYQRTSWKQDQLRRGRPDTRDRRLSTPTLT